MQVETDSSFTLKIMVKLYIIINVKDIAKEHRKVIEISRYLVVLILPKTVDKYSL